MDMIADLAKRMRAKHEAGSDPYVLLLGAGASISSGTALNRTVLESVVGSQDQKAFDEYMSRCSSDERFAILRNLVEGASPSPGYSSLAELIRAGYFDLIFSTNFDPLLEDAIAAQRMRRRDYVFLVHGVMEPDFIVGLLDNAVPRVKLLKLHGDLFYCKFFYTGEEIKKFPPALKTILGTYLNHRDVLIVGHDMRDSDINLCLKAKGSSSIWFVNPKPPTVDIAEIMKSRQSEKNYVSGADGYFDAFFTKLRDALPAEVSVDVLGQSIFTIGPPGGQPVGSGFLLRDNGLLVTDSNILAALGLGAGQGSPVGVKAQVRPFIGGAVREAELVVAPQTVLDYAVFKIKANGVLEVSPLELADDLPIPGEPVTACISLGDAQGFRDGHVTKVDCSIPIDMGHGMATIDHLIETDIRVKPGACGSPLVRKNGQVVGTIVAGNPEVNLSYALTSPRLKKMLAEAGLD